MSYYVSLAKADKVRMTQEAKAANKKKQSINPGKSAEEEGVLAAAEKAIANKELANAFVAYLSTSWA